MRITLVNADDETWASGMRSISSTLRKAGHDTTMIFAGTPGVSIEGPVVSRLRALVGDSQIIGISSMSRGAERAKALIKGLRPLGRTIVWGGMYPTLFPEDCTSHADLVCRGEGEQFVVDLVDRVASGKPLADIPNGAYVSNGRIILNGLRPPIADLDSLPLLDYASENEYVLDAGGSLLPNTEMRKRWSWVNMSGSRGCGMACAYCSNSQLMSIYGNSRRYVRKMSVRRFVEAAREYRRMFPRAKYFFFTDEDFFARPVEEMRELAETYPVEVGLPFQCMASPHHITGEKVALAAKAGMVQIDVGLESGSVRVRREVFRRFVSDEIQIRAAQAINEHARGSALYFLIIGNPYEERVDLIDGLRFLGRMPPPFSLRAYNLVFIPGTSLFDRACEDGIIKGADDSASNLDFLGGFDWRTHDWKRKNIYLNSLLLLMHGESTRWRMGSMPRMLVLPLSHPRVVEFCDRHAQIGKTMCAAGRLRYRMLRGGERLSVLMRVRLKSLRGSKMRPNGLT